MRFSRVLPLALAGAVTAQSSTSLVDALSSQNATLSTLTGLLATQPDIVSALNQAQNITILAPSNDALNMLFNNNSQKVLEFMQNPTMVAALLSYHVLNGTYYASSFTNTSQFIPTLLTNQTYANITGGQRVQALATNNTVAFYSALKENSTVVTPNVNFTGGTIHVINRVLSLPLSISNTLKDANLTAALGAVSAAGLGATLTSLRDITVFAPNNDAFNNIGNITGNLTTEQLGGILTYHVVAGKVDYSTLLGNTSLATVGGTNVTIREINGTFYVNSAKIVIQDVLVSNGVVHVIDNVLNPQNAAATPNPTGSNPPAFSGAGTTTGIPFTSGIPGPTSTAPVATSANPGGVSGTRSSSQLAPARTAAVGAAALFGGAALFMNL